MRTCLAYGPHLYYAQPCYDDDPTAAEADDRHVERPSRESDKAFAHCVMRAIADDGILAALPDELHLLFVDFEMEVLVYYDELVDSIVTVWITNNWKE